MHDRRSTPYDRAVNYTRDVYGQLYDGIQQIQAEMDRRDRVYQTRAAGLERLIDGLRERVDMLSRELTQRRDDLVSKEYLVHQDIAGRLEAFVNQDLYDAARTQSHGPGSTEEQLAGIVACVSAGLFDDRARSDGPGWFAQWLVSGGIELPADESARLYAKARQLTDAAAASGHHHRWYLDGANAPLDERRQQRWPGCTGDHVTFVVAPGYAVEGKVYRQQYVFTVAAAAAGDADRESP